MADSAPTTSAERQSVGAHHRIGMRRVAQLAMPRPAANSIVAAFLLLSLHSTIATSSPQLYIVCKESNSHRCLTFQTELYRGDVAGSKKLYLDSDFSDHCFISNEKPYPGYDKFLTVTSFGNGIKKRLFCKSINFINEDALDGSTLEGALEGFVRVRRDAAYSPRGRYRGQTQSQYLAIDRGSAKDEGKAEAHSAADSSRATVSGNSGMGQAQSQSMYDPSCEDCVGRTDIGAESLKRRPGEISHQGGSPGTTGSGPNGLGGVGPGQILDPRTSGYGVNPNQGGSPGGDYSGRYGHPGSTVGFGPGKDGTQGGSTLFPSQGNLPGGHNSQPGFGTNPDGTSSGIRPPVVYNSNGMPNGNNNGGIGGNNMGNHPGGIPGTTYGSGPGITGDGTHGSSRPGILGTYTAPNGGLQGGNGNIPGSQGIGFTPGVSSGGGNMPPGSLTHPQIGGGNYGPGQNGRQGNNAIYPVQGGTQSGFPVQSGAFPGGSNWPTVSGSFLGPDGLNYYCCVVNPNGPQVGGSGIKPPGTVGLPNQYTPGPASGQGSGGQGSGGQYGPGVTGGQFVPGASGYGPGSSGGQYPQGGTGGQIGPGATGGQFVPVTGGGQYRPGTTGGQGSDGQFGPGTSGGQGPGGQYGPGTVGGQGSGGPLVPGTGGVQGTGSQFGPGMTVSQGPGSGAGQGPGGQYGPGGTGGQYGPGTAGGQGSGGQYTPGGTHGYGGPGGQSGQYGPETGGGQGTGGQYVPSTGGGGGGTQYGPITGTGGGPGTGGQYGPGAGGQYGPGAAGGQGTGGQYSPGAAGGQGTGGTYGPGTGGSVGGQYGPGTGTGTGGLYGPGAGGGAGGHYGPGTGGTGSQFRPGTGSGTDGQFGPGTGGTGGQFVPITGGTGSQYGPGAGGGTGGQFGPSTGTGSGTGGQFGPGTGTGTSGQYIPGTGSGSGGQFGPGTGGGSGGQYGPGTGGGTGGQFGPGTGTGTGGQYGPGTGSGTGGQYGPGTGGGTGGHYGPVTGSGTGGQFVPGTGSGTGGQFGPGTGGGTAGQFGPGMGGGQGTGGQFGPGTTGGQGPITVGTGGQYGPGAGGQFSPGTGGTGGQYGPGTGGPGSGGQFGPGTGVGTGGQYGPGTVGTGGQLGLGTSGGTGGQYGPNMGGGPSGQYGPSTGGGTGAQFGPGVGGQYGPGSGSDTGGQYGPGTGTVGQYGPGAGGGQATGGPYGPGSTGGQIGPAAGGQGSGGQFGPGTGGVSGGQYGPGAGGGQGTGGQLGPGGSGSGGQYSPGQTGTGGFNPNGSGGSDNELASGGNQGGVPQNVIDPNSIADGDDSEAEASVNQAANGTVASASSKGGNDKGRAQTNVHGTYTGSGSFSAQAEITGENKAANSQVTGNKKSASSTAQGSGRNNKAQANVELGLETGSVVTGSQSEGTFHSSNSQVQGSVKGGMADAQARGPGSTSSQAQIGFTPYKEGDKSHDLQKTPFVGGGIASAQSSGRTGMSQSQLHGTFKYGITYNGAAQAGSSLDKDAVFPNRLPFDKIDVNDESNKNINVDEQNVDSTERIEYSTLMPQTEQPTTELPFETEAVTELNKEEPINQPDDPYGSHRHADHHASNDPSLAPSRAPPVESRRSFQSTYNTNQDYEYVTDKDDNPPEDYDVEDGFGPEGNDPADAEQGYINTSYNEFSRDPEATHQSLHGAKRKGVEVRQTSGGNTQHILLGSLTDHDAEITQRNSERPDESRIYQPGERVPGTGGYTIPVGFTGSVKSVASKDKTYVVGSKESPSQAQTVSLSPGSGRVKYNKYPPYARNVNPKNLRSLYDSKSDDNNRYVSVSKSVTRSLDGENNVRKQYSHTYYTKSSSCGYFTFTCTMVSSAEGRKKVCKPKMPTNPDGTPMRCN